MKITNENEKPEKMMRRNEKRITWKKSLKGEGKKENEIPCKDEQNG